MLKPISVLAFLVCLLSLTPGKLTAAPPGLEGAERSPLSMFHVTPTRIVWKSDAGVRNADSLLKPHAGQAVLKEPQPPCVLTATAGSPAGVLIDFGRELNGYVELITPMTPDQAKLRRVRIQIGRASCRERV